MADTLETLQIELTAKVDQVQASLNTVVQQLTGLSSSAEKAGAALAEGGEIGAVALRSTAVAAEEATIAVRLFDAATGTARNSLLGMSESAGALGATLGDMGGELLVAAAGLGLLVEGVKAALEHSAEAETSYVRLGAVIQATGQSAGLSADQVSSFAEDLSQSTGNTKESIENASAVMLTFGAVSSDSFQRAMTDAADLSAVTGNDLTSSVRMLGRALEDPVNGLTAMRRAGIVLTDQQKQVIESFVQSGDQAGAMSAILTDVEGKVGGVAAALGNTLTGASNNAKNAFDELLVSLGNILNQGGRITSFVQGLADKLNNLTTAIDLAKQRAASGQTVDGQPQSTIGKVLSNPLLSLNPLNIALSQGYRAYQAYQSYEVGAAANKVKGATEDGGSADAFSMPTPQYGPNPLNDVDAQNTLTDQQERIKELNEDAAAAAADAAEYALRNKAIKDGQPISQQDIDLARSNAAEIVNLTSARKADTSEAKKAQEESDELTKSLNEALIAAQKQDDDVGLTVMAKAASDAAAEVAKYAAQFPLLNGQLTDAQQKTEDLIVATKLKYAADSALYSMYEATLIPLEEYQQTMKQIGELEPFAKTPEQIEAVQRATDNANDSMNALKTTFEQTASGITEDFDKTFTDIFETGTIKFKSIAQTFYDTFAEMLAKMAVLAIASPVIVPIVEGLGSSFGISQTGIDKELTSLGMAGLSGQDATGAGSAFSLSGLGTGLAGIAGTSLLGSGSIASAVDQFGADHLGIGTSWADDWDPATDATSGVSGGISSLANVGNAVGGFAGSALGSAVFGSSTAGSIGGAVGGIAGSFIPIPVLGSALGAFAGTGIGDLVGSLFGGKPSDMTEAGEANLGSNTVTSTSGATSGKKFSQANTDERDSLLSFATSLSSTLASSIGTTLDNQLTVKIGNRDGSSYTVWGQAAQSFDSTSDGMKKLAQSVIDLYAASGKGSAEVADLDTAIKNIDFSNATQAASDLQFAANFESLMTSLTTTAPVVSAVDTEMANLNTTFDTYRTTADRLGLSLDKVNTAYQAQIKTLQNNFLSSYQNTALNDLLPGYSDLAAENASYTQSLKDAATLGLNNQQITEITLEHQLAIKGLLDQNNTASKDAISNATTLVSTYSNLSDGFSSLLDELNTGDLSTASPTATLDDLRSQVESVGAQAQNGDTDAQSQLLTLIPEFLKQSASVNGYDTDYAADQAMATTLAESAKSVADQQLTVQQNILNAANDQTSLLEQIAGAGTSGNANDKLVAAIKAGYTGLTNDQISAIYEAAGVTVTPGNGARTAALNSNSAENTQLNDVFHALGVPGFATGGSIGMGAGKPGVDSVPILTMPGEYVMRAKAVAALGVPTLNYMNSTGRMPSNDNVSVSDLSEKLDRLTDVVYAGFSTGNGHLSGIRQSSTRTAANTGTF